MTDKRLSITAFVSLATNRARIARLFLGADRILLTVNKVPRYEIREYKPESPISTETLRAWAECANGDNEGGR